MIIPINLFFSNAYLVKGDRPMLVDTGSPGEIHAIQAALNRHGVSLSDLALILHTHGHSDHAGNSAELRRLSGAPVAVHHADAAMLCQGRNRPLPPTNLTARLIKPLVDKPFAPVEPDIVIEQEMSLAEFGVDARVVFTPGHTAGSITLLTATGEAIVGDVLMGGFMGGRLFSGRPGFHYYAEDLPQVRASLGKIMAHQPTRLYVGHGGPLLAKDVHRAFAAEVEFVPAAY